MFEQILGLLSLEKLIFAFKEKELHQDFSVHFETRAIRSASVYKISDSDLVKKVLPREISVQMSGATNLNLLAFVFALRHKILMLNSLFHLSAMGLNKHPHFELYKKDFERVFGSDFKDSFECLHEYLQPQFWGRAKRLPIFGFSAIGCHFAMREVQSCRAFDAYHLPYCKSKSQGVFCKMHSHEHFWHQTVFEDSTVQAKMSQFYVDLNNFSQFDETSLKKLIDDFFQYFKQHRNSKSGQFISKDQIQMILNFYRFSCLDDLKVNGANELRRRFLEKARQFHPDMGGAQEAFREARENYEYLREILER